MDTNQANVAPAPSPARASPSAHPFGCSAHSSPPHLQLDPTVGCFFPTVETELIKPLDDGFFWVHLPLEVQFLGRQPYRAGTRAVRGVVKSSSSPAAATAIQCMAPLPKSKYLGPGLGGVMAPNHRQYKPSGRGVREAQGHQLVPSPPVEETQPGADCSLCRRSSQRRSCSCSQTTPLPLWDLILGTDKAPASTACLGRELFSPALCPPLHITAISLPRKVSGQGIQTLPPLMLWSAKPFLLSALQHGLSPLLTISEAAAQGALSYLGCRSSALPAGAAH